MLILAARNTTLKLLDTMNLTQSYQTSLARRTPRSVTSSEVTESTLITEETIKNYIKAFATSQDVKANSRDIYERTVNIFFMWVMTTGRHVEALRREDVLQWKEALLEEGKSPLTVGNYLTAVRKFYSYLEGEFGAPNIARGVKTPRRQQAFKKQHLTESKCVELLDYYKEKNLRDYAITTLALRTGLRCIEIVRANIEDITFISGQRVLRVWGKGRDSKDEFVVLTEKTWEPIKNYLAYNRRNARLNAPLFTSNSNNNNGGRLTTRTVSSICKEALKAIGLDGREFTAHSLRHTTAVTILKHGGNITDAQAVLRHSNPSTTQIYTESIKQELRLSRPSEQLIDVAF